MACSLIPRGCLSLRLPQTRSSTCAALIDVVDALTSGRVQRGAGTFSSSKQHLPLRLFATKSENQLVAGVAPLLARGPFDRVHRRTLFSTKMADVEVMDEVQRKLMFEDECILVDENDVVIGHDSKYNCHLMEKINSENLLHRAFSVFLFNSKNELLLQQRSSTKVTFPLVWTNTCCSHPLYRDTEMEEEDQKGVKTAAQRKLEDELGIGGCDAPPHGFTCLGRIHYKAPSNGKWGEHEVDYLLFMQGDVSLNPNPEEVAAVRYVNPEELKELVRQADAGEGGIKLSPWFRLVVDKFLYDWWKRVKVGTLKDAVDMHTIHRL